MDEEARVKKQLIRNTILNLIAFSIIFSVFGIFIYSNFCNTLYVSADSELKSSIYVRRESQKSPIHQGISAPENVEGAEKNSDNFASSNSQNAPESTNSNGDEESNGITTNGQENVNAPEPKNTEDISSNQINKDDSQNPRLIYIYRSSAGELLESSVNNDLFSDIDFDANNLNEIYDVTIDGKYLYRAVNTQNDDGSYRQILINVDSEKDIADQFKKNLIIAICVCVILIVIVSYILSRWSLKPIVVSWKKQTEFVQDASHELRTPLTVIRAKQEKLLENPNSTILENAEDISITLKETSRLTKLIKELMDLARSDSNEMKLNKEHFKLDEELESIVKLYKDVAKGQKKNLEVNLNFNSLIYADSNKIRELMVILLDNALKYTNTGDKIVVKTSKRDNKCIIEVIDSGIGISKEDQQHIFERFYRAEKSRAREKGGMGLGLSIAYNIAKAHKGIIKIDKNMTKGSRFIVKIPVN